MFGSRQIKSFLIMEVKDISKFSKRIGLILFFSFAHQSLYFPQSTSERQAITQELQILGRSHVLSVMVSARRRWRLCRNRRLALIAAHTLSLHRTKGRPSKLFQSAPQQIIFTGRGQGWPFYSPHVWLSHKSTHTHLHRQGVLQVVPRWSTHRT